MGIGEARKGICEREEIVGRIKFGLGCVLFSSFLLRDFLGREGMMHHHHHSSSVFLISSKDEENYFLIAKHTQLSLVFQ